MTLDSDAREALRIGTRASALARWQADWVAAKLHRLGHTIDIVLIQTEGDVQQVGPISEIVGIDKNSSVGVFTKEIQRALLDNEIDIAVHSLKDLPTSPVDGLHLAAVPERANVSDTLISNVANSLDELPHGARIGTGSLRRRAQLLNRRPDFIMQDIRGNVGTRLAKLDAGEYDAILLAQAGLERLGLEERITQRLPLSDMLPAPGQGALGIECRADDSIASEVIAPIDDLQTRAAITAERTALAKLEGGCLAALGAWARIEAEVLKLSVVVLSETGDRKLDAEASASIDEAAALGERVADELLSHGAAELLRKRI